MEVIIDSACTCVCVFGHVCVCVSINQDMFICSTMCVPDRVKRVKSVWKNASVRGQTNRKKLKTTKGTEKSSFFFFKVRYGMWYFYFFFLLLVTIVPLLRVNMFIILLNKVET